MAKAAQQAGRAGAIDGTTCVLFRCHRWILAVPSSASERLVGAEEVRSLPQKALSCSVISVRDRAFVAWNLGTLLDSSSVEGGWLLLQIPYRDQMLPMAVQVGHHLMVTKVAPGIRLSMGLFRVRERAYRGAFVVPEVLSRLHIPYGLVLDPFALWREEELSRAASALASHA